MNEQNIMENNEVLEVAEEVTNTNSTSGLKIIGGVLVVAGAIYGGLKLIKKIKAKREESVTVASSDDFVEVEDYDVDGDVEKKDKKKN